MPKKHFRRRYSRVLSWNNLVMTLSVVLPLILIGNMIFCILSPSSYPIENLSTRIPLRSLPGLELPEKWQILLMSSVQFCDAPMNTKLTYKVSLNSLSEASFNVKLEYYLTEKAIIHLSEIACFKFEEVDDLEASLDGNRLICKVTEIEGVKYYVIPELNLTKMNEIRTFVTSFRYRIVINLTSHVRIPWLFNENYAQYINFPLPIIEVQENTTSDINKFSVRFDLPFRRILVEQSGWKDAFVPPESIELTDAENQLFSLRTFEYPITQNCKINGNVYSFETHFSEQNIANTPSLTLVPDSRVPILMAFFLASPIYVSTFAWLEKRRNGNDSKKKKSQSKGQVIKRMVLIILKLYAIPLGYIIYVGIRPEAFLPILYYIYGIINPVVLVLVLAYPAIFCVVHYLCKGRI